MNVRVLIVPNTANQRAVDAARELAEWLGSEGIQTVMTQPDADSCGLSDLGVGATEVGEPGLAVALGGDGTILKAVHVLGSANTPVLGVNLGRRGFLSGASAGSLQEAVASALAGDVVQERRATLHVRLWVGGRDSGGYIALNEVYVGRVASGRAVSLAISVSGKELMRFAGDGVVVATPTGSTAYALSAGGPVLAPDVCGNVVVAVAPHSLSTRPLVVGPSDVVEISLAGGERGEACVTVDGDAVPCRQPLDRVEVCRGEHEVLLVKLGGRDFYDVMRSEFLGR